MSARTSLSIFAALLLALAVPACDQQPVDLSAVDEDLVWTQIDAFPSTDGVRTVWGSGPDDVYVGYSSGEESLRHFDGQEWEWVSTGEDGEVGDIWGSGPADVYITNNLGVRHFDGVAWTDAGVSGRGVVGTSAQDVYVFDYGAIHRFDGSNWATVRTFQDFPGLVWDAVAVPGGRLIVQWRSYFHGADSLLHWDGSNWSSEESPGRIESLCALGPNDVMAGGSDSASNGAIWRWNGAQWQPMTLPTGVLTVRDIMSVNAGEAYAATCCDSVLLRFDGVSWQFEAIPGTRDIYEVWASSSSDVYLVAEPGLLHGDGTGWARPFAIKPQRVQAVWAESPQRLVAVGWRGVYRFDQGTWTEEHIDLLGGGPTIEIVGRAMDDLYVADSYEGVIHYDGTQWTQILDEGVSDISLASDGSLFTVSYDQLARYDGAAWEAWDAPENDYLRSVWAASSEYAVAIGGNNLWGFDGSRFEKILDVSYPYFDRIWGVSPQEVYLAGLGLHRYNGSVMEPFGPPEGFSFIAGTSSEHIIAAGGRSVFFKDGADWHASPRGSASYVDLVPALDGSIVRMTMDSRTGLVRIAYHRR